MTFAARIVVASAVLASGVALAQEAAKPERPKRASIYDPTLDARAQVEKATASARRDSKRILVMFGGDWCGWCHRLHDIFARDEDVRRALLNEYVVVMVDTEAPHAKELLEECRGDVKQVGYPFLAVLDLEGKVVTRLRTDVLEEGDHHDPKKVKAFLDKWAAPMPTAEAALNDALARAKSEDKLVLLHFGAPWCGWCHELDGFLARKEIATVLGRDFVDVKIDQDRMAGGKELDAKYRPAGSQGIPWFAFLDAQGKALATSDGPDGNIGYPAKPEEIAHFVGMLKKVARRIEPSQIEAIEAALKKEGDRIDHARREGAEAAEERAKAERSATSK